MLLKSKWKFLHTIKNSKRESKSWPNIYNPIYISSNYSQITIKNQWSNHLTLLSNPKFKSTLEDESLPPKKKKSEWKKEERKGEKHEGKKDARLNNKKNKTNRVWPTSRVPNYFEIMLTSQKTFSIPII